MADRPAARTRARLTTPPEQRSAARVRQHLEILVGVLGFFTLALFVSTLAAELSGRSPVGEAFVLLVSALLLGATVRYRRTL